MPGSMRSPFAFAVLLLIPLSASGLKVPPSDDGSGTYAFYKSLGGFLDQAGTLFEKHSGSIGEALATAQKAVTSQDLDPSKLLNKPRSDTDQASLNMLAGLKAKAANNDVEKMSAKPKMPAGDDPAENEPNHETIKSKKKAGGDEQDELTPEQMRMFKEFETALTEELSSFLKVSSDAKVIKEHRLDLTEAVNKNLSELNERQAAAQATVLKDPEVQAELAKGLALKTPSAAVDVVEKVRAESNRLKQEKKHKETL